MAYQNNNHRLNPQAVGKKTVNPTTQIVNKQIKYRPDSMQDSGLNLLAQGLADLGKGIITVDNSGILQQKAQERAIELFNEDNLEGKNKHEWQEAQKKVKGLEKFNPYIQDSYKSLVAKDCYQKSLIELRKDPNFFKRDEKEIMQFIQESRANFTNNLKELGLETRISGEYLKGFNEQINNFYNDYVRENANYTYDITLDKHSKELSNAVRAEFYNIHKDQQGTYLSNLISSFGKANPDIPQGDILEKIVKPMALRVIKTHTGTIEATDFINALKNTKVGNLTLADIEPDIEVQLRDTFRNAHLEKVQEEEFNYNIEQKRVQRLEKEAKKELFTEILNNPEANIADLAKDIVLKYDIPETYGSILSTLQNSQKTFAALQDVVSDPTTIKYLDTCEGLETTDMNEVLEFYKAGKLSRDDFYHYLNRDIQRDKRVEQENKTKDEGYKAVFDEAKNYANNLDTKAKLRKTQTQQGKSTLYADYHQQLAAINTQVKNGELTSDEASKRIQNLQSYVDLKLKTKKPKVDKRKILMKAHRAKMNKLLAKDYDKKTALNSLKTLGMFRGNYDITSGIKDDRTVTLKDGKTVTRNHQAYDITGQLGQSIYMPKQSNGVVLASAYEPSMGNFMLIELESTGDVMLLQHLMYKPNVEDGTVIKAGHKIGHMGTTGDTTGVCTDISFYGEDGETRLAITDFTQELVDKEKSYKIKQKRKNNK